jgi:hypothetical protein
LNRFDFGRVEISLFYCLAVFATVFDASTNGLDYTAHSRRYGVSNTIKPNLNSKLPLEIPLIVPNSLLIRDRGYRAEAACKALISVDYRVQTESPCSEAKCTNSHRDYTTCSDLVL